MTLLVRKKFKMKYMVPELILTVGKTISEMKYIFLKNIFLILIQMKD